MAEETKLMLKFNIGNNKVTTFNYKYAKPSMSEQQAIALGQAIITNGSIFKKVPLSLKDIKLIMTDTTDFYDEN